MERMEALKNYYTTHNEDARLTPKRGMVEFLTTVRYVEKYLKPGMRILEIGAGTGRYCSSRRAKVSFKRGISSQYNTSCNPKNIIPRLRQ